ncbi:hypothetical protein DM01DRAFT_1333811 [Hesseltinella vesiculosa]|uniref:C2H2-type domain-containing protein n=1 Tax=Hesseltinella vesiculosa TaxID=101127 RepID=A0A1X2GNZ3_9FUNG|nr:hypothetical protein DM01DRAFT_1333811 [Hesseltinella vesiculosa]
MAFLHDGSYPSPQWDNGFMPVGYCELLNVSAYPSPNVSPCMSDDACLNQDNVFFSSLMETPFMYPNANLTSMPVSMEPQLSHTEPLMVPPLQYPEELALDLMDQFIQHHDSVLVQSYASQEQEHACANHSHTSEEKEKSQGEKKRRGSGQQRRKRAIKKPDLNMEYPCTHCPKIFNRPYNLQSHLRTHSSDRPYACNTCGRTFARQHDRNRHQRLHWGFKPYACTNCKKAFARMDALNRHLRVDNGCGTQLGFMS